MRNLNKLYQNTVDKILFLFSKEKLTKIAGAIVYRSTSKGYKVLLLKHKKLYWDLPKGHVDENESIVDAAIRELFEETGIKDIIFYPDFIESFRYTETKKSGKQIRKVAFYFLGKINKINIVLSKEHKDFIWVDFEKAIKMVKFKTLKQILKAAKKNILQKNKKD